MARRTAGLAATPLVSVLTPSFNQGPFLEETLRSVRQQDWPRVEHIVVDGGSTDGTVAILERHATHVRYMSQPDRGQSHALNRAVALAKGEIIGWLNSDDCYRPGALRRGVEALLASPRSSVVAGGAEFVDRDGKRLWTLPAGRFRPPLSLLSNPVLQPAAFIRRDALERVGGWDESLHMVMDLDLWLRLRGEGRLSRIHAVLARVRLHDAAKTSTQSAGAWRELAPIVETLARQEVGDDRQWRAVIAGVHLAASMGSWRATDLDAALHHASTAAAQEVSVAQPQTVHHAIALLAADSFFATHGIADPAASGARIVQYREWLRARGVDIAGIDAVLAVATGLVRPLGQDWSGAVPAFLASARRSPRLVAETLFFERRRLPRGLQLASRR